MLFRDKQKFSESRLQRLDAYFGSRQWRDVLYEWQKQKGLFDDDTQKKVEDSGKALVNWYRTRLRTLFSHVSKAALIRNTKGGHLYYLLLASHNRIGVKIANDILSAGEAV